MSPLSSFYKSLGPVSAAFAPGQPTSDHNFKEKWLLSTSSHQLSRILQLMGASNRPLWAMLKLLTGLTPCRICAINYGCCEFTSTMAVPYSRQRFLTLLSSFPLLHSFPPFFCDVSSSLRLILSHLGLSIRQLIVLGTVTGYESLHWQLPTTDSFSDRGWERHQSVVININIQKTV